MHKGFQILLFSCLILLICVQKGNAQNKYTYLLKAYTTLKNVAWRDSVYWFPKFQEGTMLMANGFSPDVKIKINYNLFSEKMELINEKNDTIILNNAGEVKLVNLGGHVFYNDKRQGYIEVIVPGTVSLEISCHLEATMETSNGERFQVTDFSRNTTSRFDRIYQKEYSYFFMDKSSSLFKVSKSNLLKLLPQHKGEIKKYLNENPVDYKNQRDLIRLLKFCNSF